MWKPLQGWHVHQWREARHARRLLILGALMSFCHRFWMPLTFWQFLIKQTTINAFKLSAAAYLPPAPCPCLLPLHPPTLWFSDMAATWDLRLSLLAWLTRFVPHIKLSASSCPSPKKIKKTKEKNIKATRRMYLPTSPRKCSYFVVAIPKPRLMATFFRGTLRKEYIILKYYIHFITSLSFSLCIISFILYLLLYLIIVLDL